MKVTMLGTGAPLAPNRATTGLLVSAPGNAPLLIDTCGGMELPRQLAASGIALADLRDVILTHRHLDHIGGVAALCLADMPLEFFGNHDAISGAQGLLQATFPEWPLNPAVAWHTVVDRETLMIGGFAVSFFAVTHRVPTFAVRVEHAGRVFAFSADSEVCAALSNCADAADLFVCDAICATADGDMAIARARKTQHPTAREAGELAAQARVKRLVCTHIGRFGAVEHIAAEASAAFGADAIVAKDGDVFEV